MKSSCEAMSDTIPERVAVLESQHKQFMDTQTIILQKVEGIEKQITRYHGFLGGIAFLISGIGVAWGMFGDAIRSHFK